jgi:hypothetical protein
MSVNIRIPRVYSYSCLEQRALWRLLSEVHAGRREPGVRLVSSARSKLGGPEWALGPDPRMVTCFSAPWSWRAESPWPNSCHVYLPRIWLCDTVWGLVFRPTRSNRLCTMCPDLDGFWMRRLCRRVSGDPQAALRLAGNPFHVLVAQAKPPEVAAQNGRGEQSIKQHDWCIRREDSPERKQFLQARTS